MRALLSISNEKGNEREIVKEREKERKTEREREIISSFRNTAEA